MLICSQELVCPDPYIISTGMYCKRHCKGVYYHAARRNVFQGYFLLRNNVSNEVITNVYVLGPSMEFQVFSISKCSHAITMNCHKIRGTCDNSQMLKAPPQPNSLLNNYQASHKLSSIIDKVI